MESEFAKKREFAKKESFDLMFLKHSASEASVA